MIVSLLLLQCALVQCLNPLCNTWVWACIQITSAHEKYHLVQHYRQWVLSCNESWLESLFSKLEMTRAHMKWLEFIFPIEITQWLDKWLKIESLKLMTRLQLWQWLRYRQSSHSYECGPECWWKTSVNLSRIVPICRNLSAGAADFLVGWPAWQRSHGSCEGHRRLHLHHPQLLLMFYHLTSLPLMRLSGRVGWCSRN